MVKNKNILWGICGIGGGHVFRQIPLIEHFAKANNIMIFAYGTAYDVMKQRYGKSDNVKVQGVAVPYIVGNKDGLDFAASAAHPANKKINFEEINIRAMAAAESFIGKPDLVISDYEPVSAKYAYMHDAPLVTIDQQSKYLIGDFPANLNNTGYIDEVQRLNMFFPKARARIACSFFNVAAREGAKEKVTLMPPVFRSVIEKLERQKSEKTSILVYFSAQNFGGQTMEDVVELFRDCSQAHFVLYGDGSERKIRGRLPANVVMGVESNEGFLQDLSTAHGILSTAGHGLLSEAMYLGIPVLALPLPLYEQQMNAKVIADNAFGMASAHLNLSELQSFIQDLPKFAANIAADKDILLKGQGKPKVIRKLNSLLKR